MSQAMALPQSTGIEWNDEQRKIIRDQFANGASDNEFAALMETARVRGLDPFKKQIYFVKRYDSQRRCEVWATQVSIDGLRCIAERTGRYDGSEEPEWTYDDHGKPIKCRVAVHRKDHTRPAIGVAFFAEYVQTTKDGAPTRFWKQMPHVMIAKCAEALAIRKGFPEQTAGLYIPEEMAQADNGRVTYDGEVVHERPSRPVAAVRSIDGRPVAAALAAGNTSSLADELKLVSDEMVAATDVVALNAAAARINALKSHGLTDTQRSLMMQLYQDRRSALGKSAPPTPPSGAVDSEQRWPDSAPDARMREPGEEG